MFLELILLWLHHESITAEVVSSAMDIIQDYLELGLMCPDLPRTGGSCWPMSFQVQRLPILQASSANTLTRSLGMLVRYEGHMAVESVGIVACVAKASEPVVEEVVRMMALTDPGLIFSHALGNGIGKSPYLYFLEAVGVGFHMYIFWPLLTI